MAKIGHQPRYDPAGLIPGQQARCGPPSRLRLEVDVGESLPVAVADDVAALVVLRGCANGGSQAVVV
jgi:hypothetical protein